MQWSKLTQKSYLNECSQKSLLCTNTIERLYPRPGPPRYKTVSLWAFMRPTCPSHIQSFCDVLLQSRYLCVLWRTWELWCISVSSTLESRYLCVISGNLRSRPKTGVRAGHRPPWISWRWNFLSERNWIKQLVQKPPLPLMIIIMSGWDWIAVVKDSLRGILENQLEAVWVKVGDGSSWNTYKTCFFSASLITNINQRNEWCTTMNESKEWKFYFL